MPVSRIQNRRGQLRSHQSSPLRAIRAILGAVSITALALFLFQLDAFPHHKQQKVALRQQLQQHNIVSPGQLLLQQPNQNEKKFQVPLNQASATETGEEETQELEENESEAEDPEEDEEEEEPETESEETPNESREQEEIIDESGEVEELSEQEENEHEETGFSKETNEDANEPDLLSGEDETDPQSEDGPSPSRRFVMTLGNLKGDAATQSVVFQTRPDWAPIGAAHLHKLIDAHFYDECRFFRVVPNFVVQFGISGNPSVQKQWRTEVLEDDPVEYSNKRGTITFATSGANTRTTQLFINLGNNAYLDKQGFAPVAEIVDEAAMDAVVGKIQDKHRQLPNQGMIQQRGNDYLREAFPDLSYIVSIRPYEEHQEDTK